MGRGRCGQRLAHTQWENVGAGADRVLHDGSDHGRPGPGRRADPERGEARRAHRHSAGRIVFVSGHFANFEVMAAAKIIIAGIEGVLAYRGVNNPYIDRQDAREPAALWRHPVRAEGAAGRARGDVAALKAGAVGGRAQRPEVLRGPARAVPPAISCAGPSTRRCAGRCASTRTCSPAGWKAHQGRALPGQPYVADEIELPRQAASHADVEAGVAAINAFIECTWPSGEPLTSTGGSTAASPTPSTTPWRRRGIEVLSRRSSPRQRGRCPNERSANFAMCGPEGEGWRLQIA